MAATCIVRSSVRLGSVVALGGLLAAGARHTSERSPEVSPGSRPALTFTPGDIAPSSIAMTPQDGYGRSYGIAIVEGRIILVIDRESRRILEVIE